MNTTIKQARRREEEVQDLVRKAEEETSRHGRAAQLHLLLGNREKYQEHVASAQTLLALVDTAPSIFMN